MKLLIIFVIASVQALMLEMNHMDAETKREIRNSGRDEIIKSEDPQRCKCENKKNSDEVITFQYLKRIVNLLVQSTVVHKNNKMLRTGTFVLNMEDESYKFLVEFPTYKEIDVHKLRQLNTVLNGIFEKQSMDFMDKMLDFLTPSRTFFNFIFDARTLMLFGTCVALYISYQLFRETFSFYYILKYFIIIIFIIDYAIRYQNLLNEMETQNLKNLSQLCKDMPWYTYLFSNRENCEKKVVTPLDVALLQVRQLVIVPLVSIGVGMGGLSVELWRNLPFPWNIIIFPLMLAFLVFLVAILLSTMNELPFKLNLLHLFHLEFLGKPSNIPTSEETNRVLNVNRHRSMIRWSRKTPNKHPRNSTTDEPNRFSKAKNQRSTMQNPRKTPDKDNQQWTKHWMVTSKDTKSNNYQIKEDFHQN